MYFKQAKVKLIKESYDRSKRFVQSKLGQVIKSPTIRRTDVAEGTKGRALMLSDDWLACAVAFTEEPLPRGVFYVTEEDVVKYGLQGEGILYCPYSASQH